ncbi:DegT/DnrJ/EryC1/StrS family aminotransferase [Kushneria indalinina]|uniref:dTDP-4-amino-4,6-dideoxygalactose transaminase n=1 Tax=Kushneria indalinina DSM 14324 TaxID=1122140 RepID=A0A3D9DYB1_9GAMM|nr:DegT/DnrJ/EryC1/StrS family aminotransferase [Kushneria indalinina]REC95691.1 dTDP-4-amino-4,6-dideoxygalactose transaminase [Kushneria indalinina DSM 14324]
MIPFTRPFLPPEADYQRYINDMFSRQWLTNHGPLVQSLEEHLRGFLEIEHCHFVANGTLALQLAFKALALEGEVITTPFSFVATLNALLWEGLTPIFADIDPQTLTLDPARIEAAITPNTSAILATHIYGHPCDVEAIEAIARRHDLKVIYDGAHAFGSRHQGRSLLDYGDISITSFHATKLFHTIEGGALFTRSEVLSERIASLRAFGQAGGAGINAKGSEAHAAMGLALWPWIDHILGSRADIAGVYDRWIDQRDLPVTRPDVLAGTEINHAYYPILLRSEAQLERVVHYMAEREIHPRRYFHPALNRVDTLSGATAEMPVAEDIASRVLCLPNFVAMTGEDAEQVMRHLEDALLLETA